MRRWIFHLSFPFKKHVENSIRGIKAAAKRHFTWIDLDELITKADPNCSLPADDPEHVNGQCLGHVVGCHWDRPMERDGFFDPQGVLHHHTRVREMSIDEALRLKTKDGYSIRRIKTLLVVCAMKRVGAWVEPKDDPRFEQDWPWQYQKSLQRRFKFRLRARAIRNFPSVNAGLRRVQAARRNGIRANTIRG